MAIDCHRPVRRPPLTLTEHRCPPHQNHFPEPLTDRPDVRLRLPLVRRTRRRQPALVDLVRRRTALPRTRAATRLGDHRPRRRRHRARHPEDRQGGRRLPARARRRRRPVGRDGGQALPRHRPPQLPSQRRLHRGPSRAGQPGGARRRQGHQRSAGQSGRPVGERRVGVAQAVLDRSGCRCPTRCRSTAPSC